MLGRDVVHNDTRLDWGSADLTDRKRAKMRHLTWGSSAVCILLFLGPLKEASIYLGRPIWMGSSAWATPGPPVVANCDPPQGVPPLGKLG